MDAILIYLLKANLLIVIFYLAYYFLVQKETFFNNNRWFLLSGLFTSVLIPLFFIKKIVIIETPKLVATNLSSISNTSINPVIAESINWYNILVAVYIIISIILVLKIASELVSFFKLIKNKKITVNKPFAMVDIDENINPFSFFKYIVFNSTKYSNSELENILNHEKVHSKEKHSLDVLIAKVFCTVFWFNPFVWLYKKAIIQNLEYIADQKAIQNIEDKKAYQMTLLKVVTDHNCLSITNSFYQSLIKKRIVMLNKNQSKQKNVWKYALVIPVLVAFVMLFQIKVIAQEKITHHKDKSSGTKQVSEMTWTKDTPDDEIKNDVQSMKIIGVEVNYSDIKRNTKGEITAIKIAFKDKSGKTGNLLYSGDTPIRPIILRKEIDENDNTKVSLGELAELDNLNQELSIPEPPTPPTPPTPPMHNLEKMPKPPTPPIPPTPPTVPKKPIQSLGANPNMFVIIDGKKNFTSLEDIQDYEAKNPGKIVRVNILKSNNATDKYGEDGKNGAIEIITTNYAENNKSGITSISKSINQNIEESDLQTEKKQLDSQKNTEKAKQNALEIKKMR